MKNRPENEARKQAFYEALDTFKVGMLGTMSAGNELRARPMALAEVDRERGELWFVTSDTAGKADEILDDPRVNVTFQSTTRHLSISGGAQLASSSTGPPPSSPAPQPPPRASRLGTPCPFKKG